MVYGYLTSPDHHNGQHRSVPNNVTSSKKEYDVSPGNEVTAFCPGFQKGRAPSEKGTFSAVSGPPKGYN